VKFTPTGIAGAFLVEIEPIEDERGFFARTWCAREFETRGLNPRLVQCSVSFNRGRGTLRGLHLQHAPHQEAKLVRCTRGAIFDVVADLRGGSPSFGRWYGAQLSQDNRAMLYIPEGCAHGFQTLEPDTEVLYQMSEAYHPECAGGVRWDDPALAIAWPIANPVMSERDRTLPGLERV
jgi:dTDP-4-dehydrorhamnose 3,5-epimerase